MADDLNEAREKLTMAWGNLKMTWGYLKMAISDSWEVAKMSFGIEDDHWINPPEPKPKRCGVDCEEWERCPCCFESGWCREHCEFTYLDEECLGE